MKRGKVIVQAKFVVGYWELIPMESGAELLSLQDTTTVRVAYEIRAEKKQRLLLIYFEDNGRVLCRGCVGGGGVGGNK